MDISKIPTKDREFKEVNGGYYDDDGYYLTPNGSFWDPDGFYFNRHGYDVNGGYYDDNGEYIDPVTGYNDENAEEEDDYYVDEEFRKIEGEENIYDNSYDDNFDEEELYRLDLNKDIIQQGEVKNNKPKVEEKKEKIEERKFNSGSNLNPSQNTNTTTTTTITTTTTTTSTVPSNTQSNTESKPSGLKALFGNKAPIKSVNNSTVKKNK